MFMAAALLVGVLGAGANAPTAHHQGTAIVEGRASGDTLRKVTDQPYRGFVPGNVRAVGATRAYLDSFGSNGEVRVGTSDGGRTGLNVAVACPIQVTGHAVGQVRE